jgi:hypothetical protein
VVAGVGGALPRLTRPQASGAHGGPTGRAGYNFERVYGRHVVRDRLVTRVVSGADPGADARLPGDVQGGFRVG